MPQRVAKEITYSAVLSGDSFGEHDVDFVTNVDRKPVWVTLSFASGGTTRRRGAETVTVWRNEPTEEELRERALKYARRLCANAVAEFRQVDFIAELHADIDKHEEYRKVFDWSNLAAHLKKQAMRKLGFELTSISSHLFEVEEITTDVQAFEVCATWYAQYVLSERRYYSTFDPLSRSTAVLANVLEDLDRWAKSELIEKLRWCGEPLLSRAQEIKTEWDTKNGR